MIKERNQISVDNNYFKYFVYYPSNQEENIPAIVFLHGIGERGENLDDIETYGLPKYMNSREIPFLVIAPQCQNNNMWSYHLRDVEKIINIEQEKHNFDKNNIFLCGYSMGAYGAWNYLIQRPELFKGIVSVSGGIMLPVNENLTVIKDKPMLLYHGTNDPVVDCDESTYAYDKLKLVGANDIELRILPDRNHFITDEVFGDNYIYDWLEKKAKVKVKRT